MKFRYNTGFFLLALLWGGSFLGIRYSIEAFPPVAAAAIRVAIGALFTWFFMIMRKERFPKDWRVSAELAAIGFLCLGLPWALLFWGEQFVSPGVCSIINSTTPLFTVLITALFIKHEAISGNKIRGVVIGLIGILIIFGPNLVFDDVSHIKGLAALVCMAVCYALGISWIKPLLLKVGSTTAFFMQCVGALAFLVPVSLVFEGDSFATANWASKEGWIAMLYLAIFSTAIAQIVFMFLIRHLGSVSASSISYFIPLVAILLDWVVFGLLPDMFVLAGGIVILIAVKMIRSPAVPFPAAVSEDA